MAKLPYLPLYTGDWLKDPALTLCRPATRGVWIDLLCAMHELGRSGELCGTAEELARLARCASTAECVQALTDLQNKRAAEIQERNGVYTVRNRRMHRESLRRKSNAERQERHRRVSRNCESNGEGNTEVAIEDDIDIEVFFEDFWEVYPKGRKQSKGKAREAFEKAIRKIDAKSIIRAAEEYAESEVAKGLYVKMPSTWLNQECWNDDREAWRERRANVREQPLLPED